jgi:hypothetical protein
MTLEFALVFIADGELVEITPKNIRLRKLHMRENDRKQAVKRGENNRKEAYRPPIGEDARGRPGPE